MSWFVRNFGGGEDKSALLGLGGILVVISGCTSAIVAAFTGNSVLSLDILVAIGFGALGYDARTSVELFKAKYSVSENDKASIPADTIGPIA